MAHPPPSSVFAQIQDSRTPAEQLRALRALKNEIVGHQQKKEDLIKAGIVEPLMRILLPIKVPEKQNGRENLSGSNLSEDETVRLQALYVMGSLAFGGPAFMPPLHSASFLPAVLANICPLSNPPQITSAALQSLSNLTTSISYGSGSSGINTGNVADSLFTKPHIVALARIFSQTSSSVTIQTQISLAASLIIRLCRDDRHQVALAGAGVLDALSTRLAGIVLSHGMASPGADEQARREDRWDNFPATAPPHADIASILEAIAVIVAGSKFRGSKLLYSAAITAVFPAAQHPELHQSGLTRNAWSSFVASDLSSRQHTLNAAELLIPQIPVSQSRSASSQPSSFPRLGSNSFENLNQLGKNKSASSRYASTFTPGTSTPEMADEVESPLITYLIWLAKSQAGLERLMAIFLLAVLYRAGLTHKDREPLIGRVVVPMLVQLIEQGNSEVASQLDPTVNAELTAARWMVQERAPAVLAMLIIDSEYLQKTAYDSGVIKKLSKMIKIAYDPVLDAGEQTSWSPYVPTTTSEESIVPQYSRLGQPGLPSLLVHKVKVRESTLGAIAALVPTKDEYRKALIDQGVVPYIVESLRPCPDKPSSKLADKSDRVQNQSPQPSTRSPGYGTNPFSVLIAACSAVRHLSRSVSSLRTTLIDNGVVMPVFELLQHPEIEVQIAATAAVCNLVTDFSPMREIISKAGVLKVLCEHAHSSNVKLRLNALWALKHLVVSADNDVKKLCLEELGEGWLIQIISADTEDEVSINKIETEEGVDDQTIIGRYEDDEDSKMSDSIGALSQLPPYHENKLGGANATLEGQLAISAQNQAKLAALKDLEMNTARRQRKDDIDVQEQGLDFIRNLIGHVNNSIGSSETSEMIEYLFNALGRERIFEILAGKLRPRYSRGSGNETRIISPKTQIVKSIIYILVHIAASSPRHRQQVIAQTDLLKSIAQQFTSPSLEVRSTLCWLVINLTWTDDTPDSSACSQRARELQRLGFLAKLESLLNDNELDVRERAKTAVYQMKQHGC